MIGSQFQGHDHGGCSRDLKFDSLDCGCKLWHALNHPENETPGEAIKTPPRWLESSRYRWEFPVRTPSADSGNGGKGRTEAPGDFHCLWTSGASQATEETSTGKFPHLPPSASSARCVLRDWQCVVQQQSGESTQEETAEPPELGREWNASLLEGRFEDLPEEVE